MPATPAPPVVGVLALQGDVSEHLAALAVAGASAVPVRRPDELEAVDGLVIPGGESTTMLKFLERNGFFEVLQSYVKTTPTFGTCAGAAGFQPWSSL